MAGQPGTTSPSLTPYPGVAGVFKKQNSSSTSLLHILQLNIEDSKDGEATRWEKPVTLNHHIEKAAHHAKKTYTGMFHE